MSTIKLIESKYEEMSKGHKAIAKYILESYDEAAYMTAARLGEITGVSESTVVRFTMELGFDGYPHFQRMLKEELKTTLTSVQRLNYTERFENDEQAVLSIMQADMDNLKETINEISVDAFSNAVQTILGAKKIYLMGLRSSSPLSSFMHFYMTVLFDDVVHIHSSSANEVFEQILPITENDVMIGISFPRYSQRTINSMDYAKKKGAKVIVITDKDNTAMTKSADIKLFAKSSMASFVDSLAAPLSLINALLVSLGMHRRDHIHSSFEALEQLWSEYRVYEVGKDRGTEGNITDI
ncbi:MAG: MurR/RpiR family transcriptional regulator [Saccharofermentanaceae bacterium]|jgi:DNA-binding MurR/RpiR family transcriptional regulator|nr:MurR/RpiR family transcriptional regulator [Clostridia bacterium]NLX68888.1 MurR/RpiR family transcriptional regulator [Clostridiaceae bacterium]HOO49399.1 MurR/RpiR family transcriptional regulator [Saccharofermentans sp.]HPG64159.1 MurR/RpiR family transcriptional regulator [Saccharofermentans sp.]HPQ31677.1 MurR/RpiR family transcriptional regulator [Saccharofermentans sp.]